MNRSRSQQGFTIVELMIVLTVIGVMSALLAPGLQQSLGDARAASAAEDVVRLSRHLRARIRQTGRAHLLEFSATGANGLGMLRVWEGMNNMCRTTPWATALAAVAGTGHAPVDFVNMPGYNPASSEVEPALADAGRQVIHLLARRGPIGAPEDDDARETIDAFALCYEPTGRAYQRIGTGFSFEQQGEPYAVRVERFVRSMGGAIEPLGVAREVVFEPGNVARFRL